MKKFEPMVKIGNVGILWVQMKALERWEPVGKMGACIGKSCRKNGYYQD